MLKPKYETLEELLKEVQATRSLDTSIEFITHVQDLIGHSTESQLYELSKQYKTTFYWVYDEAEGIEATLRFFANYSKFSEDLQTQLADATADRDKFEFMFNNMKETTEKTADELQDLKTRHETTLNELTAKQKEVDDMKKQLIELKARLYDLMTA